MKNATLPKIAEFLNAVDEWPGTLGQLRKVIEVVAQKGATEASIQRMLNGHLADLAEANYDVADANRPAIRHLLGLSMEAEVESEADLFDPNAYFRDRPGLWVSENFQRYVLAAAGRTNASPIELSHFDLPKRMTDAKIRKRLGEGHTFEDPSEFCVTLAQMIDRQWGGKSGELLNNGRANLFYVRIGSEVFAVSVYWFGYAGRWYVNAPRLDGPPWRGGNRAFSRLPAEAASA